jgi:hypothetical protein
MDERIRLFSFVFFGFVDENDEKKTKAKNAKNPMFWPIRRLEPQHDSVDEVAAVGFHFPTNVSIRNQHVQGSRDVTLLLKVLLLCEVFEGLLQCSNLCPPTRGAKEILGLVVCRQSEALPHYPGNSHENGNLAV